MEDVYSYIIGCIACVLSIATITCNSYMLHRIRKTSAVESEFLPLLPTSIADIQLSTVAAVCAVLYAIDGEVSEEVCQLAEIQFMFLIGVCTISRGSSAFLVQVEHWISTSSCQERIGKFIRMFLMASSSWILSALCLIYPVIEMDKAITLFEHCFCSTADIVDVVTQAIVYFLLPVSIVTVVYVVSSRRVGKEVEKGKFKFSIECYGSKSVYSTDLPVHGKKTSRTEKRFSLSSESRMGQIYICQMVCSLVSILGFLPYFVVKFVLWRMDVCQSWILIVVFAGCCCFGLSTPLLLPAINKQIRSAYWPSGFEGRLGCGDDERTVQHLDIAAPVQRMRKLSNIECKQSYLNMKDDPEHARKVLNQLYYPQTNGSPGKNAINEALQIEAAITGIRCSREDDQKGVQNGQSKNRERRMFDKKCKESFRDMKQQPEMLKQVLDQLYYPQTNGKPTQKSLDEVLRYEETKKRLSAQICVPENDQNILGITQNMPVETPRPRVRKLSNVECREAYLDMKQSAQIRKQIVDQLYYPQKNGTLGSSNQSFEPDTPSTRLSIEKCRSEEPVENKTTVEIHLESDSVESVFEGNMPGSDYDVDGDVTENTGACQETSNSGGKMTLEIPYVRMRHGSSSSFDSRMTDVSNITDITMTSDM